MSKKKAKKNPEATTTTTPEELAPVVIPEADPIVQAVEARDEAEAIAAPVETPEPVAEATPVETPAPKAKKEPKPPAPPKTYAVIVTMRGRLRIRVEDGRSAIRAKVEGGYTKSEALSRLNVLRAEARAKKAEAKANAVAA